MTTADATIHPFEVHMPGEDLAENPRKTCAFTRFRVLRTTVHHRPPAFVTSADSWPGSPVNRRERQ